ncbi:MAG: 50S ribosomal protein L17 [Minisyncoccales bacterium]
MKKQKKGRKFSRQRDQRKALLKSLASALVLNEKIKTTEAKSKEVSKFVEKNITKAKKGTITARRLLTKFFSPKIVKKLINDIGPRYKKRKGGYTRIIKLGSRKSDGARMAIIELVK